MRHDVEAVRETLSVVNAEASETDARARNGDVRLGIATPEVPADLRAPTRLFFREGGFGGWGEAEKATRLLSTDELSGVRPVDLARGPHPFPAPGVRATVPAAVALPPRPAPARRPQRPCRARRLGRLPSRPLGGLDYLEEDAFSDAFGGKTLPGGRLEEVTMEQVSPSHRTEYLLAEKKFRVIRQDTNGIEAEVADDVALPAKAGS